MADWVQTRNPYELVSDVEVGTGTVLRRVPFSVAPLGQIRFAEAERSGVGWKGLDDFATETEVGRVDKAILSPGIVLTPECDIYQHKVNRVVVAQIVSVSAHILNQGLTAQKKKTIVESIERARESNPGAFNIPGLFPLLRDERLNFADHLVLLDNVTSLAIVFADGQQTGLSVTSESIDGHKNIWFRLADSDLRSRLTCEFVRHMLRIGLPDATI